ncbi:hypothetical protein V2S66_29810 [Streptomyces sp. V4-01]|uniref:Uncharacterized protein n=1 Tax=Actinacidiphila polyblastidii TaxID=3110430 RepID=A0ABU7PJZ5_9ACTN|nr:hypothetical protein [Streptomyces sp. V4-01]
MTARQEWSTAGRVAWLVGACLLWAGVIAASPWIPTAAGVVDLTGVTMIATMVTCGSAVSLALGALLGRARAYWTLAACAAVGPFLWVLDVVVHSDPDVHTSDAPALLLVPLALVFVSSPLAVGALAGRACGVRHPGGEPAPRAACSGVDR